MLKNIFFQQKKLLFLFFLFVLLLPQTKALAKMNYYPAQGVDDAGKLKDTAYVVCYDGLVPCGKQVVYEQCVESASVDIVTDCRNKGEAQCSGSGAALSNGILHCQICHLFVMINGAINYLFLVIIPPLVVAMFVLSGIFFYLGGARPNFKSRAKEVLKTTLIGLVLIYGSFLIVGLALSLLGVTKIEPINSVWNNSKIFQIDCLIKFPESIR